MHINKNDKIHKSEAQEIMNIDKSTLDKHNILRNIIYIKANF